MKTVDCRGLSCPEPIVQTKRAIGKEKKLTILVDNFAAKENVSRLGNALGFNVTVKEDGSDWSIIFKK